MALISYTTVRLAVDSRFHAKAKHFRLPLHMVRDYVAAGDIAIDYVASGENAADLFTKPLARTAHERLVSLLRMTSVAEGEY